MSTKSAARLWANGPNLISLSRMLAAPAVVASIASRWWTLGFVIFLAAGASDALDGWLATRFNLRSKLGAYIDPLADKVLLTSIYAALAWVGVTPISLAVLIVFRDVMIVGAVVMSWVLEKPFEIKPLLISKANTSLQIACAAAALGAQAFGIQLGAWFQVGLYGVAALTLASLAAYLSIWLSHMSV